LKKKDGLPPRRDLQLEALLEILNGKRLIHCHSYRQDEVLMLIGLANEFKVKIGTFQHILEGYKIADEIAKHGAGGSTFADWWAYKWEAFDAIPDNAAMMHDRGVVTSVNSDSGDLARRLNSEAAKSTKYGYLPADEALNLVARRFEESAGCRSHEDYGPRLTGLWRNATSSRPPRLLRQELRRL